MPRASALMLVLAAVLLAKKSAQATFNEPGDDDVQINVPDYGQNPSDLQMLQDAAISACIPRGDACNHRLGDCCDSLSCRCNLWGANCRCQRKGLF